MFQHRTLAIMMAVSGILGCQTVPNQERLVENEKEIADLRQKIDNGEIKGSYQFGENNQGKYGEMAIAIIDEKNNTVRTLSFKRNEKGWFDRKDAVRPLNTKVKDPVRTSCPTRWIPINQIEL